MKFDKRTKAVIAVYAIVLLVYVFVFALIPFPKTAASWITFSFTVASFVVSLAITKLAFEKKETPVSKLYGYPVFKVGILYVLVQFAVGVVICLIGGFVAVPAWIAVLSGIVLLGAAMVGVIAADQSRDIVENIEVATKTNTETMTMLQIRVSGLLNSCEDESLREELKALETAFQFSDPVSNEHTAELECKLKELLDKLTMHINKGDSAAALQSIKNVSDALKERNHICQATK